MAPLEVIEDLELKKAATLHQQRQYAEAVAIYRNILAHNPKHGESHHLLGALLLDMYGLSRFEEAKRHLQNAISCNPQSPKYRQSLGVAYQRNGNKLEAVECLERANEKDPLNTQILMQLGRLLKEAARPHRAAEVYRSVTLLEPDHPMAHYRAAAQFRSLGKYELALVHFRQHLRLFPDHAESKFWIAALSGDAESTKAPPPGCIASLFDQYSDHFDQHLVNQLGYRTPQLLMDALFAAAFNPDSASAAPPPLAPPWARCVDLGVGTGLMGPLLREHVTPHGLEGVDLSSGMISKAQNEERGYDKLQVAELVQYLQEARAHMGRPEVAVPSSDSATAVEGILYECLVAADVFVYLGDLRPVMSAASAVSRKGALFAFSVEAIELQAPRTRESPATQLKTTSPSMDAASCSSACEQHEPFSLLPTGRYVHSAKYLRDALSDTGWCVSVLNQGVLRNNGGQPVFGHLCAAVKV